MINSIPEELGIIAGKGSYPYILAESAIQQGVKRIVAIAFKRETDCKITHYANEVKWVHLGELSAFLKAIEESKIKQYVMAGQITPTHLFNLRMDKALFKLLYNLKERNAHTIFGAIGEELKKINVELLPAYLFMEKYMPEAGLINNIAITPNEQNDINLGLKVAKTTSELEIGQTVVIKNGTIIAVEAFEGTDATIKRAKKLCGSGAVVVKVAKLGHDMRFDIPVIGIKTIKTLKKINARVLAIEAKRAILLEKDLLIYLANKYGISLIAIN